MPARAQDAGLGGVAMKTVLLFWTIVAAMAPASVVNAQGRGCDQIVQNINDAMATIDQNATSYWTHRANFVDLIFGPSSQVVPNASQVAEQEKSQADAVKEKMPGRVNSLKGLLTAAQAQNCLSPAQLSAIGEPTIKHGKRVNFDQFPPETPTQSSTDRGPPRMPQK
jgi:hypothetical protein